MDCTRINEPLFLGQGFINVQGEELNDIFRCFFKLHYTAFVNFAKKRYTIRDENWIYDAFADGLLGFYLTVKKQGAYEEKSSSVKTVLFKFCNWKLLTILKEKMEDQGRIIHLGEENETIANEEPVTEVEEMQKWEKLQKAYAQLGEMCRNLLKWRKLDKLNNEEIAQKAGIDPRTVNDRVYKCFNKLKDLI